MWQTVNMTPSIDPFLIDNHQIRFNFSAWMGGFRSQNDNAVASLTFIDQSNQRVGSAVTIGPVLAVHRINKTSILFRQTSGFVPAGARSFMVMVTLGPGDGTYNNGFIDNIAVLLHL